MAFQWNISLVANLEGQNMVFETLCSNGKYIKMIFKNMWLLPHLYFDKHKLWQLKMMISACYWSILTTIIYERSYEWKVRLIFQWEKHLIYVFPPEWKIIKNIPVIIKRFKNIINANNNSFRARADYVKETYLQKQKVSHCHITTTTKHKSYGMNLVVTEHKLMFL